MNEVDLLKVLWFVARFIAAMAVYLANSDQVRNDRISMSLIPIIIFTTIYVMVRALAHSSGV